MGSSVHETTVIDAPVEKVWNVIRDFNGLPEWHPAVKTSTLIEGQEHQVGAVRLMEIVDGAKVKEVLLSFDPSQHTFSYGIVESGFVNMENYVSIVKLSQGVDENHTVFDWSSTFVEKVDPEGMEKIIRGIYTSGFQGVRTKLGL